MMPSLDGLFSYVHTEAVPPLHERVRAIRALPDARGVAIVTDDPPLLAIGDTATLPTSMAELQPVAQLANLVARSLDDLQQRLATMQTDLSDAFSQVTAFFDKFDNALQHVDGKPPAPTGPATSLRAELMARVGWMATQNRRRRRGPLSTWSWSVQSTPACRRSCSPTLPNRYAVRRDVGQLALVARAKCPIRREGMIPQAWKRLDAQVVKALYTLRLDLLRYLRPLTEAVEAHLTELHSWTTARSVTAHPSLGRCGGPDGDSHVWKTRTMLAASPDSDVTLGLEARQLDASIQDVRALFTALLQLETVLAVCGDGWTAFSAWMKTGALVRSKLPKLKCRSPVQKCRSAEEECRGVGVANKGRGYASMMPWTPWPALVPRAPAPRVQEGDGVLTRVRHGSRGLGDVFTSQAQAGADPRQKACLRWCVHA